MRPDDVLLSICVRCRDGREDLFQGLRGGARLANAVLAKTQNTCQIPFKLRGVRCMSQCKRACTISLTASDAFSWVFGDLDPALHADDVIALTLLYSESVEGFMPRDERPVPMRAGVLGRLPPIGSQHEVIEPLPQVQRIDPSGPAVQRRPSVPEGQKT